MIIVYGFKPLTIFIENSFLDAMVVLDLLPMTFGLLITSNKPIFSRLLKYKIISLESSQRLTLDEKTCISTRTALLLLFKLYNITKRKN